MFDNREKLENFGFFYPGGHNFHVSEKLTDIVTRSSLGASKSSLFLWFGAV